MADNCFSVILLLSLFIRITDNNRYYLTQSEPVNKKTLFGHTSDKVFIFGYVCDGQQCSMIMQKR